MRKIIATTTNSLEGWIIQDYLSPISTNVVVGSNIISDFKASFTDFFGGRSTTYEKRLQNIYQEAISNLKSKAATMGANCILGLKIDIDEISGKGTQMFMITAVGTPVRDIVSDDRKPTPIDVKTVDGDLIEYKVYAQRLLSSAKNMYELLTPANIQFMVDSKFAELAPLALKGILFFSKPETKGQYDVSECDKRIALLKSYFGGLDAEVAANILYKQLLGDMPAHYKEVIFDILKEEKIIRNDKIKDLLKSGVNVAGKQGIALLKVPKSYYTIADIAELEDIIETIKQQFQPLVEYTKKKKMLSNAEKDVWVCPCGTTNDKVDEHCSSCNNNIYGFKYTDDKPDVIERLITDRIAFIKDLAS